jgi:glycosyltransferase involved in cell wall biosynthesis
MTNLKFLVVQYGARHNYAVPAAFDRRGALSALYTDLCAGRGFGGVATAASRIPYIGSAVPWFGRLAQRQPARPLLQKTTTFDFSALQYHLVVHLSRDFRVQTAAKASVERAMLKSGLGAATHIYTMLGEGGALALEGSRRGLGVVSEVYIALSADQLVAEEHARYPDWSPPRSAKIAELNHEPLGNEIMLTTSNIFICPSEFVRNDLVTHWGIDANKAVVIPYGGSTDWPDLAPTPEHGRVLFAGTANLRKGIHYFASAARILAGRRRRYVFRVAGDASSWVRAHRHATALTYLGRLPHQLMGIEFASADVLVLPSLAEGSATVTYEALHAGVPVVTTFAAGSIVRDGIDGMIVPERDPEALADAIEQIVENRDLRERMSNSARDRVTAFTWDNFAGQVIDAALSFRVTATDVDGTSC